MIYIDTHAHLNYEDKYKDTGELLADIRAAGVGMVVNVGWNYESSALAARHRVPSWQQAALCRYMGWADGKMLTEEAYQAALNSLAQRHMGGGRKR